MILSLDDLPVFGVPLEMAVKRSHCHDGVDLPVIVRNCIDYIEEFGKYHVPFYLLLGWINFLNHHHNKDWK